LLSYSFVIQSPRASSRCNRYVAGDFDRAATILQRVIALVPKHAGAAGNLAACYFQCVQRPPPSLHSPCRVRARRWRRSARSGTLPLSALAQRSRTRAHAPTFVLSRTYLLFALGFILLFASILLFAPFVLFSLRTCLVRAPGWATPTLR
jgi:hypothetical protein